MVLKTELGEATDRSFLFNS